MSHSRPHFARRLSPTTLVAALAAAFGSLGAAPAAAGPLPTGGKVVGGQAVITQPSANLLQVQQGSQNAAIDWRSFNIGRDASVVFQQPSARSAVLNRVTGGDPTQILGRLQANGQVFVVNPYGIVFGRDARVDVAGLVASTANIRNDDFMAGRLRFDTPGQATAQIVNDGEISVRDGGLAAFLAPGVANRGTISARLGTVALASGEAFTLDPYGDRLVQLVVPASQLARVVNSGTLSADGGSVQISTRTAAAVVDGLINLGGVVRARSVAEHGGRIVLEGDARTAVTVQGAVDASGLGAGERGGSVQVRGADITLADGAAVDARGDAGGGSVHLGGGWHGAGGTGALASQHVARGASIDVSAVSRGAGGEAVVWSDGSTRFDGRIAARGGAAGGDGGRVEVSGRHLAFDGEVDAAAVQGRAGLLLLDPGSLRLQSRNAGPARDVAGATDSAGNGAGQVDTVATESISSLLAKGTSVQLSATEDITVADRIDARLVNGAGQRLNQTGANLRLEAGGNLRIENLVILDGGSFTGIAGAAIAQTAGATVSTGGGDVSLSAGTGMALDSWVGVRHLALTSRQGDIALAQPVVLTGRFSADILQANAGDTVRLNGLKAASDTATPAVAIHQAAGNNGAAGVQIGDHLIAAGAVNVKGAAVSLAAGKAIDTRAVSGGSAGSAVTLEAGAGGLTLDGNVYTDNAAVVFGSLGDFRQAPAALVAPGSGAVTVSALGLAQVSQVQTTGALSITGARVQLDAGTTDVALQAGTLQLQATGTATQAVDVRSSVRLGDGDSRIASQNDVVMQPGVLIEAGSSGLLRIEAQQAVTLEHLKTSGAGVAIASAHSNVVFNQALGGRAAGDTTSVVTLGGDPVSQPTLYALDVRAPEGRIETRGLLLYGLKGAPLTLDLPAGGPAAYGLNLEAAEVDVRGLVFVLDGAISIHGSHKIVIGNSIRSANGYAMSIGGGEIDLYRPTRPDGSEYRNTDIVVAQYPDGTLHFFEQLNGTWQQSTSFLSVVMPSDLPTPASGKPLPSFWLDRTAAQDGLPQVQLGDAAFAVNGVGPTRLLSLTDSTPSNTNAFTVESRLASYDPAGLGRHPYVPLVYAPGQFDAALDGTPVAAKEFGVPAAGSVDIPGTRFVPKLLITNDPGPGFTPSMTSVNGVATTQVGRITLSGPVYETDAQGVRLVRDLTGTGFESAGDLRNVALKVVSFDTRSIYQDSMRARSPFGNDEVLGDCTLQGGCLDDPAYNVAGVTPFNDYPRIVYPDSSTGVRCFDCAQPSLDENGNPKVPAAVLNPVSPGFQAAGYLSRTCVATGTCERPVPTEPLNAYYRQGEPAVPGANPNALSSSLAWQGAQPGTASVGRFEYFQAIEGLTPFAGPTLVNSQGQTSVLGLSGSGGQTGDVVKIGASLTQSTPLKTHDAPQPSRTVLAVNHGVMSGAGITMSTDGTSAYKTSVGTSIGSQDGSAAPVFTTITPSSLGGQGGANGLPAPGSLPPAPVSVASAGDAGNGAGLLNGLLPGTEPAGDPLGETPPAGGATDAVGASGTAGAAPLLVLGGRGLAQSADLGRSGAWASPRSSSVNVDHEVACTREPVAGGRAPDLPPCR